MTDIKQISRRWHEAWGTPDIEAAYRECLAPDFRVLFFGQGWVDRDAYIKGDRAFMAAFAEIEMKVEEAVAEGDTVISRMTWRGRHTGMLFG
jgi:predicted ester cyclase